MFKIARSWRWNVVHDEIKYNHCAVHVILHTHFSYVHIIITIGAQQKSDM